MLQHPPAGGVFNNAKEHDDKAEVNSAVRTTLAVVCSVIAVVVVVVGAAVALGKRRRLGNAYRHRRIAEDLVDGGGRNPNYHPGNIYLPAPEGEYNRVGLVAPYLKAS
jgi:hypothetical protein